MKTSAVFVVATGQWHRQTAPELLRKGRFDEIFLLELPSTEERRAILDCICGAGDPVTPFLIEMVVGRTEGFSGAELEQTVVEAMHLAFAKHRECQRKRPHPDCRTADSPLSNGKKGA